MIYMFLTNGFEETEAIVPLDILRRAGIEVKTVGIGGKSIEGSHGIIVVADIEDREFDDFDPKAVILPGGMPGTQNLDSSAVIDRVLEVAADKGAHIAAICAAPMILGKRGLLKGKKAVCYPGYEKYLDGAKLSDAKCVTDGKITTAVGMSAAFEFGEELVRVFGSTRKAENINNAVLVK